MMVAWSQQVQLVVYLEDEMRGPEQKKFEKILTRHPQVEAVTYISRDVAWQNFQGMFTVDSEFLQSLNFNPLPASYNLRFKPSPNQIEIIREFANVLQKQDKVESVEYGEKWISRFETFMVMLRIFLIALGGLIFLGLALVVSNTTKISVYSRKDEVELVLLIGASPSYIKRPFQLEGVILGLIGALLTIGVIKSMHFYLQFQFQETLNSISRGLQFHFFQHIYIWIFIAGCIFIGWVGSNLAIHQFLNSYYKK